MIKVSYTGGKEFAVKVRDHVLVCDQPPKSGGRDRGPDPAEFLAAALGSCVAYYVQSYLEARSLPTAGLDVQVTWEAAKDPKRIGKFQVGITLPDGASGPILSVKGASDPATTHPYFYEITLGESS